jgi:hypothetical protein
MGRWNSGAVEYATAFTALYAAGRLRNFLNLSARMK